MKKLFVVYQEEAVTAFEILGEHTHVLFLKDCTFQVVYRKACLF